MVSIADIRKGDDVNNPILSTLLLMGIIDIYYSVQTPPIELKSVEPIIFSRFNR